MGRYVNRLLGSLVEGHADSLTVSEEHSTARSDASVLEVSVRFSEFSSVGLSSLL